MTPAPFYLNAVDAAMIAANDDASRILCLMGQGGPRGYRLPLLSIWTAHLRAPREWVDTLVRSVVATCSLLADTRRIAHPNANDEVLTDLFCFVIERAKHLAQRAEVRS